MVRLEQLLKEERIRRKLTLEEAATATRIKPQFLEAIERGAYHELPSPAYAKGFVRNYAEFLGLPKAHTSALFKRDFDEKRAVKVLPEGMVKKSEFPIRRLNVRRFMIGGVVIALLSGFLLFQTRSIFFPPSLSVSSPKEGSVVSREVSIAGKTDNSAVVIINNESVSVDSNGKFQKKIILFPGKATITVKAQNRLGKEAVLNRNVTVR
jgi:cytoskeletal protein RodZ